MKAAGAAAVGVAVALLYSLAAPRFGNLAYVGIGAVLLAVGLVLGFRAWLAALACSALALYAYVYFDLAARAVQWDYGQNLQLPALVVDSPDEPGLAQLRREYQLDQAMAGAESDYARLQRIVHWANGRFGHSSDNQPSNPDPLTILREAAQGRTFRCVEYAIVTAAAARSLRLPARVVGLKRADAATARYGGGHVVAEVWLEQYLYFFDYSLDQRFFSGAKLDDRPKVMLVPMGSKQPAAFAGRTPSADTFGIANPHLFYAAP